jgi:hypothetical protein
MEAGKVLVKEGDVAIITCPLCKKSKKLSVAKYKEIGKRELRIKCSCGNIFCLLLEYRRHPRKPVKLLGKSINLSKHRERQDIIVKNISLGGIGFYPFKTHRTQKDDRLQVSFALSDSNNTPIDTNATVRAAGKDYIGCEFNSSETIKTSIGFYLLR